MEIKFPYSNIPPLIIDDSVPVSILEPKHITETEIDERNIIRKSLENPIGISKLKNLVHPKNKVLIVVDDYSRNTPLYIIIPEVLSYIHAAGIKKEDIRFMVATGTHRKMTEAEKIMKMGKQVLEEYLVMDHHYDHLEELVNLPTTESGTEVWVNRAVMEADFVIGIGHIVPHRVAGFSGGGKIIQPGICGSKTTGQTHWLSAMFDGVDIMGKVENPVRQEIDAVAMAAGLRFLVNVVLDGNGKVVSCHSGDPIKAFREGAQKSTKIFSAHLDRPADIVVTDSYPTDTDLWIAAKGIYSGDMAMKKDGILILVTPCPEGISSEYPQVKEIGYRPYKEIKAMVESGKIKDLALAAHLVHVGSVISEKGKGIIVSPGISRVISERIGFQWAPNPQSAFDMAIKEKSNSASVVVLRNGGEILPVIGKIDGK